MTIAERAAFAFAVFLACWPFLIVLHYAGPGARCGAFSFCVPVLERSFGSDFQHPHRTLYRSNDVVSDRRNCSIRCRRPPDHFRKTGLAGDRPHSIWLPSSAPFASAAHWCAFGPDPAVAGFPDMFSGAASASISAGVLIKVATGP